MQKTHFAGFSTERFYCEGFETTWSSRGGDQRSQRRWEILMMGSSGAAGDHSWKEVRQKELMPSDDSWWETRGWTLTSAKVQFKTSSPGASQSSGDHGDVQDWYPATVWRKDAGGQWLSGGWCSELHVVFFMEATWRSRQQIKPNRKSPL